MMALALAAEVLEVSLEAVWEGEKMKNKAFERINLSRTACGIVFR